MAPGVCRLLYSIAQQPRRFSGRFIGAVLAPVLLFALGLAAAAGFALRGAAQQADHVSATRQTQEVGLAVGAALDELAQSQGGVAIWNQLADQMARPHPDWKWIDSNVGEWLNFDFGHDADLILDQNDKIAYAMVDGRRVSGSPARALREAAAPLVEAARGRTGRSPSPHERLPGKPLNPRATVRTAPRAIHATDLTLVGTRPAVISVMRIIAEEGTARRSPGPEPLLVSVRYLDTNFANRLEAVQMLAGMHFQRDRHRGSAHQSFPLVSARGRKLG